jgi:hypothetical protein
MTCGSESITRGKHIYICGCASQGTGTPGHGKRAPVQILPRDKSLKYGTVNGTDSVPTTVPS